MSGSIDFRLPDAAAAADAARALLRFRSLSFGLPRGMFRYLNRLAIRQPPPGGGEPSYVFPMRGTPRKLILLAGSPYAEDPALDEHASRGSPSSREQFSHESLAPTGVPWYLCQAALIRGVWSTLYCNFVVVVGSRLRGNGASASEGLRD